MTMKLQTDLRVEDPDDLYQRLIALHQGLSEQQSLLLNARLILLLANHIGDSEVLEEAFTAARAGIG